MASGEQNITALPVKTNTGIANSDYFMGIDSAEGYQILIRDVAKYIMENYNGSTLAGQAQTPKAAIDALNSNMTNQSQSMERLNSPALLTDTISPGYYYTTGATGIPTGASSNGYLRVYGRKSDLSILKVMEYRPYNSTDTYVSMRTGSESWSGWEKLPTRAEVDALNSNQVDFITVDLSGTAVTSTDAGWYYAEYSLSTELPSGATAIGVEAYGTWDASVFYGLNGNNSIVIKSPTSRTLGNNRKARVFFRMNN